MGLFKRLFGSRKIPNERDFYRSQINGRPASILVNLAYLGRVPVEGFPHLVSVFLKMTDPADHGMGTRAAMEALGPVEDRLTEAMTRDNQHFPGRIRGEGAWQLYFYTRDPEKAERRVREALKDFSGSYEINARHDPGWTFFSQVLAPDDERMQWIRDRRLVEILEKHGDSLTEPRPVEHWIYFTSAESRGAFVRNVTPLGFEVTSESDDPKYGVVVRRTDSVELEAIHQIVMELCRYAEEQNGEYDGWETQVLGAKSG